MRARHFLALAAILPIALAAQQRDAVKPAAAGTGEISGVVWSADANPQPVRRVVVSISGGDMQARSVITDESGRFVFARLPAGTFAVTAKKPAYLPTEYGSSKPGRPGSRLALAAGERRAIALTLFKGAVIAGVLRDPSGQPLAGVSVAAVDARAARDPNAVVSAEPATTDDRGAYRIYGLTPGEYVIAASPTPGGVGDIGSRSAPDMDAVLAALAQQKNRPATTGAATPTPPPMPRPRVVGYAPIYFPGTPLFSDGARIRIAAGDEQDGVSFSVSHVPVAGIEGAVSGVANLAAVQLAITPDAPRIGGVISTGGISSVPPDANGVFKYGNLAPGRYRIVARARAGPADPASPVPGRGQAPGGRAGGGVPLPGVTLTTTGDMLYAVADVEVRGQDVTGVTLALQLGGSFAGKVVFDAASAPLPDDFTTIRAGVSLVGGSWSAQTGTTRVGPAMSSVPPVNLSDDGSFVINGIGPGLFDVNTQLPADLAPIWKLRSAIVEGRDLLDTQIEGPNVRLRGAVLTLSDKRTEISGTLQAASGQPLSDYYVVAFSTDRANWRIGSRRNLSARPDTSGRFVLADPPAGEYFLAALADLDPLEWQTAESLEQIATAAVKVRIGEGEKKVQSLQIR